MKPGCQQLPSPLLFYLFPLDLKNKNSYFIAILMNSLHQKQDLLCLCRIQTPQTIWNNIVDPWVCRKISQEFLYSNSKIFPSKTEQKNDWLYITLKAHHTVMYNNRQHVWGTDYTPHHFKPFIVLITIPIRWVLLLFPS